MKPKEFDELVRQKFDQNDFAYNPKNWDQLAEKLDGRAQKRRVIMWWWVPLAGMAASVALAVGIAPMIRQNTPGDPGTRTAIVQTKKFAMPAEQSMQNEIVTNEAAPMHKEALYATANYNQHTKHSAPEKSGDWFHVILNDKPGNITAKTNQVFNFAAANGNKLIVKNKKEDLVAVKEGYNTFMPEEEEVVKAPKIQIILSGGYNHGNQNSGYMAGATFRRMINDKLFIESDVDFATSNNSQSTEVWVPGTGKGGASAARHIAARNAAEEANKTAAPVTPAGSIETQEQNYNLSYAQVSPSIGYKIINRMSVALGPDFQQMLVDNRPATSTVDRGNIQVAPVFDVGFVGKTEYSLTKKIKAGISYRKGMNDFINPVNKYIDRDYLQFQLKCTIFNK